MLAATVMAPSSWQPMHAAARHAWPFRQIHPVFIGRPLPNTTTDMSLRYWNFRVSPRHSLINGSYACSAGGEQSRDSFGGGVEDSNSVRTVRL